MLKRLARNEGAKVQLLQILFDMWRDHPQMLVVLGISYSILNMYNILVQLINASVPRLLTLDLLLDGFSLPKWENISIGSTFGRFCMVQYQK